MTPHFLDDAAMERAVDEGASVAPPRPLKMNGGKRGNESLTAREQQVLRLLIAGRRNAEIGLDLCVTSKTVEFHVRNVLQKLGARSRADAVRVALQYGLCATGDGLEDA